jgi:hypothetical protein
MIELMGPSIVRWRTGWRVHASQKNSAIAAERAHRQKRRSGRSEEGGEEQRDGEVTGGVENSRGVLHESMRAEEVADPPTR